MECAGRPVQRGGFDVSLANGEAHRAIDRPSICMFPVKGGYVRVEFVTAYAEPLAHLEPITSATPGPPFPRVPQLLQQPQPLGLVGMKLDAAIAKSMLPQTTMHNVQRCGLLRDKQHGLSNGQALRDQVGDRLTLARPWRAHNDEIVAF